MDFDDLELLARDLLRREPVRAAYAERFERSWSTSSRTPTPPVALLRALDRDNLFLVGDELQSIYGFRHADVEVFRARRAQLEPTRRVPRADANFRAARPLLDASTRRSRARFEGFEPLRALHEAADDATPARAPLVELLLTDPAGWERRRPRAQIAAGLPAARWRQAEARLLAQRVASSS